MQELIDSGDVNEASLLGMLSDRERADEAEAGSGRLDADTAHALTSPFIVLPDYGTRCSTVLLRDRNDEVRFTEQRFAPDGTSTGLSEYRYRIDQVA